MALQFARGAIQWLSADAATTLYTVSGLAFQPKVIRASCVGIQSATNATSSTVHSRRSTGFATGTASRRCIATQDQDAAASMTCTAAAFNDCILATVTSTPARDGALDLDSIQSDGFKFIVDDAAPVNITVLWEAWGGTDITDAGVGDIAEPAATGDQDYATGGVVASMVFLAGCQSSAAVNTAQRNDSGFMFGFTAGPNDNFAMVGNNDDGSASADCDRSLNSGRAIVNIPIGGGAVIDAAATCTQLVASTGMRLNWAARATTNRRYIYCWVKGGQWRVFTTADFNTATAGNTLTVSGLAFQPIGLLGFSENTSGGVSANDLMGFGSAASTSDRATLAVISVDGAGSADIDTLVQYDEFVSVLSTTGTVLSAIDVNAINSDGFQLIVDTGGGSTVVRLGIVAFASVASLPKNLGRPKFYRRKRLR